MRAASGGTSETATALPSPRRSGGLPGALPPGVRVRSQPSRTRDAGRRRSAAPYFFDGRRGATPRGSRHWPAPPTCDGARLGLSGGPIHGQDVREKSHAAMRGSPRRTSANPHGCCRWSSLVVTRGNRLKGFPSQGSGFETHRPLAERRSRTPRVVLETFDTEWYSRGRLEPGTG
jgi:hypothetical protein